MFAAVPTLHKHRQNIYTITVHDQCHSTATHKALQCTDKANTNSGAELVPTLTWPQGKSNPDHNSNLS